MKQYFQQLEDGLAIAIEVSKTIKDAILEVTTLLGCTPLELSRQLLREKTLTRFKYVRTCVLARELCLLVRTNRVAFNPEDVKQCCSFVSDLCKEAGCLEQSELCRQASEAVMKDEEQYLDLCKQSCMKCGEARQPTPKNKTSYVA
jgi:hypothetical protein